MQEHSHQSQGEKPGFDGASFPSRAPAGLHSPLPSSPATEMLRKFTACLVFRESDQLLLSVTLDQVEQEFKLVEKSGLTEVEQLAKEMLTAWVPPQGEYLSSSGQQVDRLSIARYLHGAVGALRRLGSRQHELMEIILRRQLLVAAPQLDRVLGGESYLWLGQLKLEQQPKEALGYFLKSYDLDFVEHGGNSKHPALMKSLTGMTQCHYLLRDYAAADRRSNELMAILDCEGQDVAGAIWADLWIGKTKLAVASTKNNGTRELLALQAHQYLVSGWEVASKTPPSIEYAQILTALSRACMDLQDLDSAMKHSAEAVELLEELLGGQEKARKYPQYQEACSTAQQACEMKARDYSERTGT